MAKNKKLVQKWEFKSLAPENWDDFEQLFGANGACAGCWCAWFLMTNNEYKAAGKGGHREEMRTLVQAGAEPGVMAYADGVPAGWIALGPRERYRRLATSTHLAPVDDQPVWVVPCFFIHRDYRRMGLMEKLLEAAIAVATSKGVKTLEAFPVEVEQHISSSSLFPGKTEVFYRLGFHEVARRENRPILRKDLSIEEN